ncbi:11816_t:CDS:1, partial [Acaulospora colombiana]
MDSTTKSRDPTVSAEISKLVDSMDTFKVHSDQPSSKLSASRQPKPSLTLKVEETKERSVGFLIPDKDDANNSHCVGLITDEFVDISDSPYRMINPPVQNEFYNNSPTDSSIDISVRDLNSDILVSLVDREAEMRDLFARNQDYFDTVRQSIFPSSDEQGWHRFLDLLYSPRHVLSDAEWMSAISNYMEPNPTLLVKFKEIVGYYEVDENPDDYFESTSDNGYHESNLTDRRRVSFDHSDPCYTGAWFEEPENKFLDVSIIRDYPRILENLESSYPQFFNLAHQFLGQETERRG